MKWIQGADALEHSPLNAVVAIGNFDGVHIAHQQIISLTISKAGDLNGSSVVYTFRPHPRAVLHPERAPQLLTTYEERKEHLAALGLDLMVEEPFSRDFSSMGPEEFFGKILIERLNARAIVVGHDFSFGRAREGHIEALQDLCRSSQIELTIVPPYRMDAEIVSSTRIRSLIEKGDVLGANRLLGYRFAVQGVIVAGDGRGRKIGFPTANIKAEHKKVELPNGVYATCLEQGGKTYQSVTNIGVRPTFQKNDDDSLTESPRRVMETHLLSFSGDLYGESVKISFIERIRDEMKFPSGEALRTQIASDIQQATEILSGQP